MKNMVQNIVSNDRRLEKFQQWGKIIGVTFSAQALIQLLGLLTGVLIIRLLSTEEYAFYTIANTMLGTMTVLADAGISSGVMVQGGKVWQDRTKLGVVIETGLKLRRKFGIISLIVSLPIMIYLLTNHGANVLHSILITLAIIPSFFGALSDNLLETSSKLHQGIKKLQKNQLFAGIARFVIITSSLMVVPFTAIAILGNGIARIWANVQLRKISSEYADPGQNVDPVVAKEILTIVKRSLPGAIYFCISGQITIWLISFFGSTEAIAHIGALSRLTTILTVFTTLFSTLITPRFARLKADKKALTSRFIQIQIALILVTVVITGVVALFPRQILWILGKDYAVLNTEVLLITISSCLAMLSGITYSVVVARGWIINPAINISINVLFQFILVLSIDLTKTYNVLMFSIVDYSLAYIILILYFFYSAYKMKISYETAI